jgi:hypothetical protein
MYLGEHLIDSVDVSVVGHARLHGQIIKDTMQQLLKKHKKDLSSADQHPTSYLEGVLSHINEFRSLMNHNSGQKI